MALENLVVVAPDVGSAKMARGYGKRLRASFAIIDKRRPEANKSEVLNVVGDVDGMNCLLVDDMVDTAGTLANAVNALKERGAKAVYAAATHALFSGEAVQRLSEAPLEEMVVTNTIAIPKEKHFDKLRILSVGDLLSKAVDHVHSNESVSQLFDMLPDN
jgi:ribose-phosphate pyrophosphokinase